MINEKVLLPPTTLGNILQELHKIPKFYWENQSYHNNFKTQANYWINREENTFVYKDYNLEVSLEYFVSLPQDGSKFAEGFGLQIHTRNNQFSFHTYKKKSHKIRSNEKEFLVSGLIRPINDKIAFEQLRKFGLSL